MLKFNLSIKYLAVPIVVWFAGSMLTFVFAGDEGLHEWLILYVAYVLSGLFGFSLGIVNYFSRDFFLQKNKLITFFKFKFVFLTAFSLFCIYFYYASKSLAIFVYNGSWMLSYILCYFSLVIFCNKNDGRDFIKKYKSKLLYPSIFLLVLSMPQSLFFDKFKHYIRQDYEEMKKNEVSLENEPIDMKGEDIR